MEEKIKNVFSLQDNGMWSRVNIFPQSWRGYLSLAVNMSISLREIFSKSGFLRVMGKQDESTIKDILEEFGTP